MLLKKGINLGGWLSQCEPSIDHYESFIKEEDFKTLLDSLRKEHKKARHIVYAYRIGMKSKSCDDGEPKGTAGHPLLDFLYKKDLNNIALFVVRYFGGTKLGAGRLFRTYLQAGVDVINESELISLER